MSTVVLFVGLIITIACMIGMLNTSKKARTDIKEMKKTFGYYMGISGGVLISAISAKSLVYLLLGLVLFGIGATIYIWKLKNLFKEHEDTKKVIAFIEANKEEFGEALDEIDKLGEQREKLRKQLLVAELKLYTTVSETQEKAKRLMKDKQNAT